MKARHPRRFWLATIGLLSLGATGACNGRFGNDSNTGQSTGSSTGTGGTGASPASGAGGAGSGPVTGTGAGPNSVPIVTTAPPPAESAGVLPMRRLTYPEYDHLLADLLGDTTAPAETTSWPAEQPNKVDYLAPDSVAELLVDTYQLTANAVVDKAMQAAAAGLPAGKLTIPCKNPSGSAAETTCATQFVTTFGQQVYRRPVATAEQQDLLALFSTVRGLGLSFTDSIGAMVKAMVQSPNFLYHWEVGPTPPRPGSDGLVALTPWQVASRLASVLWQTGPDDALMQAAQSNQLSTPAQVAAQVTRMLADPRATNGLYNFHEQWLFTFGTTGARDIAVPLEKSSPLFTDSVKNSLKTEFSKFVSSVYAGDGTLQALFTAPYAFINHDLAALYGVPAPSTDFAKVSLDPTKRGGIFTQVAFLATLASDTRDHPINRGLSIYLKALCGEIDFSKLPAVLPPVNFVDKGTTRQSFDAHGQAGCAKGCHSLFDPPGFAFENYDGNGQYRTTEAGQNVDSTGSFVTPGNATLTFQNALDLSKQLAQSPEAQACIDRQWTRYLLGRPETAAESGSMSVAYQKAAATSGFSIRDLLVSLVTSKAFLYRQPSPGESL